ncbi:hypothetical protein ACIP29_10825 [Streptomyces coelicoflavus]|uniref:hypothetical protein n=1 Tax=Streptomyces coelicoflavus TaxID=285562 RepID=UPI0038234782
MTSDHDQGQDGSGSGSGCEPGGYSLIDTAPRPPRADGPPYADCVVCREPTEYPESYKGITLCPVCEWQEAQRTACSG